MEVACTEFPRHQLASTASSGPHLPEQQHEDEVAYVRLREMEDAESKLRSIGYTWKASQGTSPGELLLKGSKHSEMSALSRKLADIEVKLKVSCALLSKLRSLGTVLVPKCKSLSSSLCLPP